MRWISEQLASLAKHVIVSTENSPGWLEEQNRILRPELNVFLSNDMVENCSATEQFSCGLAKALRVERAYCREFVIESSRIRPTTRSVEVIIDDKPEYPAPYSCPRCFYNQCILALLDRVEHAAVEIELPIGQSPLTWLYLVGLIRNITKEKLVLALECTVDKKKKTFLVALKGTSVHYIEVTLHAGEYNIDQTFLHNSLNHDSAVIVLPVDQIRFVNEDGVIENFYLINKTNIDDIYRIHYLHISSSSIPHRDVIRRHPEGNGQKSMDIAEAPQPSVLSRVMTWATGHATLKAAVAVSFIWVTVLVLRETQRKRTSAREKVSIL